MTSPSYWLRREVIDPQNPLEINAERYGQLCAARRTLVAAGAFEQCYEVLVGNFLAFEQFCAAQNIGAEVECDYRHEVWARVIADANRHAMNFLASTRQYCDQIGRGFSHLPLEEAFSDKATGELRIVYDTVLAYGVVYELRNYAQHHATVVHGIKGRTGGKDWVDSRMIYCSKKQILEDRGDFKRRILDALPDAIDLLIVFREYMQAVSGVQRRLRAYISGSINVARAQMRDAMDDFSAHQKSGRESGSAVGLAAMKSDGQSFSDVVPILLEWDDARIVIANKNSLLIRYSP